jgi:hypothetical protein
VADRVGDLIASSQTIFVELARIAKLPGEDAKARALTGLCTQITTAESADILQKFALAIEAMVGCGEFKMSNIPPEYVTVMQSLKATKRHEPEAQRLVPISVLPIHGCLTTMYGQPVGEKVPDTPQRRALTKTMGYATVGAFALASVNGLHAGRNLLPYLADGIADAGDSVPNSLIYGLATLTTLIWFAGYWTAGIQKDVNGNMYVSSWRNLIESALSSAPSAAFAFLNMLDISRGNLIVSIFAAIGSEIANTLMYFPAAVELLGLFRLIRVGFLTRGCGDKLKETMWFGLLAMLTLGSLLAYLVSPVKLIQKATGSGIGQDIGFYFLSMILNIIPFVWAFGASLYSLRPAMMMRNLELYKQRLTTLSGWDIPKELVAIFGGFLSLLCYAFFTMDAFTELGILDPKTHFSTWKTLALLIYSFMSNIFTTAVAYYGVTHRGLEKVGGMLSEVYYTLSSWKETVLSWCGYKPHSPYAAVGVEPSKGEVQHL